MRVVKQSVWFGGSALILLSAFIARLTPQASFLTPNSSQSGGIALANAGEDVITWQLLQSYDYRQHEIPQALAKHLDKPVRIPGFAVPLASRFDAVDEFLFVPNEQACIHVPAPPPHLMIYVQLRTPLSLQTLSGPLWLSGVLKLEASGSPYGEASYRMDGLRVEAYTYAR